MPSWWKVRDARVTGVKTRRVWGAGPYAALTDPERRAKWKRTRDRRGRYVRWVQTVRFL